VKTQCDRIDRLCREFGLSAMILPDIEIVKIAGYGEPLLSYHHHALVWKSDGVVIQPKKLSDAMNRRLYAQTLILPPVVISPDVAGQGAVERVRAVSGYAGKITCRLKTIWWDKQGERRVEASTRNMSTAMTLRLQHAWSLLELYENVRTVGEGKVIRKVWKECLFKRLRRVRCGTGQVRCGAAQLGRLWPDFWAASGLPSPTPEQHVARAEKFERIAQFADQAGQRRPKPRSAERPKSRLTHKPLRTTLADL
jgi:hypothetical protein